MTKKYMNVPEMAIILHEKGYEPIPVTPGEKYWKKDSWQDIKLPITPWPKNHGISLRTGATVVGLDIDVYDKSIVNYLLGALEFSYITRIGEPPKVLIPVLCPEITKKLVSDVYVDEHGVINRIEILSGGQQFVAYHIHPNTHKPYKWSGDLLTRSLPVVSKDFILYLFDLFYDLACKKGWRNISVKEKAAEKRVAKRETTDTGDKAGDLYNWAYPIADVLNEYGWKHCEERHFKGNYWTRPGKKSGVSGSVFDDSVFWCFTSSTRLEPDALYDSFGLLARYEFNGNFTAAANAVYESMKEAT